MSSATVTSKGQITIPIDVESKLDSDLTSPAPSSANSTEKEERARRRPISRTRASCSIAESIEQLAAAR